MGSSAASRRLSVDVGIGWGVTQARLDRASFSYKYRACDGSVKDCQHCVICLSDFISGNMVRRLACLHLFHTSCATTGFSITGCVQCAEWMLRLQQLSSVKTGRFYNKRTFTFFLFIGSIYTHLYISFLLRMDEKTSNSLQNF